MSQYWLQLSGVLLSIALFPGTLGAQMNMSGHVMETRDETPPEQLAKPRRMSGLGNIELQITGSDEAQMWFNQGLNLLHDFWDYESARAFEQSVRVDPQCAMCYWGLYRAQSFYHSMSKGYAAQSLAKAVRYKGRVSRREGMYIEASIARESALKKPGKDMFAHEVELWRELVKEYPNDTQPQLFLAEAVGHREGLAILESVLKKQPENSAANHYYIHALEGGDHPERALHSAEILASLAPASGHMVHMPGHIFYRVGDYARAEGSFAAAMQVDEGYMREQNVEPDDDWNFVHNLMYAIANLMEEGKMSAATALSMKLTSARGQLESTLYTYSLRDSITRLEPRLPVALRTANWGRVNELLRASAPPANRPNLALLGREMGNFATGMLALEKHDLPTAEELQVRFERELSQRSERAKKDEATSRRRGKRGSPANPPKVEVLPDALLQPLLTSLSIMSLELKASLVAAHGDTIKAKGLFATAAQKEKALGYREPPSYIRPVGESEGSAMLNAGDWSDAKAAYGRALVERPRSGLALYGVAVSAEKAGDVGGAVKEYRDFLTAWKDADPGLIEMSHARSYLAHHRG